jgi:hypothetical protein
MSWRFAPRYHLAVLAGRSRATSSAHRHIEFPWAIVPPRLDVRCLRANLAMARKKGNYVTTKILRSVRRKMNVRLSGSIALSLVCLVGCASNGRVPPAWKEAQQGSTSCDQLQGRFSNSGASPRRGESTPGDRPVALLTDVLKFSGEDSRNASVVRLTIEPNGVANFVPEVKQEDSSPVAVPTSKLVLTCSRGVLSWSGSIRDLRNNDIGDPLIGPERITFRVQRGADRALYVETHEVDAGLVYGFFPFGGSDTSSFRFSAID